MSRRWVIFSAVLLLTAAAQSHAMRGDDRDVLQDPAVKSWIAEQNEMFEDDEIGAEVLSAEDSPQYAELQNKEVKSDATEAKPEKKEDRKSKKSKKENESSAAHGHNPAVGPIYAYFHDRRRPSHQGVDIGSPMGTPIHALWAGLVVYADCSDPLGGCTVKLDHGHGLTTYYAHMRTQPYVHRGQHVEAGAVLGPVGKTGDADRPDCPPHVHFEVRAHGHAVNPLKFIDIFRNHGDARLAARFTGH